MEHVSLTAHQIALRALVQLSHDSLTAIYHEQADKMLDCDLHDQQFSILEPIMEYHIDGIDEACDDEDQTNLKILVATAILKMQSAVLTHDVTEARNA